MPVLVVPPFARAHRELYTDEINDQCYAYLGLVQRRYPFALADYRGSLPDECLVDNHHATPEGAERFTTLLVHEFLAPLWRELDHRFRR
jgi:hypothetical protein